MNTRRGRMPVTLWKETPMGFRIRCAVSRVPLNAGDAVVAVPVASAPIGETGFTQPAVCGTPVAGVMDGYGRVVVDGFLSWTYEEAMIVHAGVNAALLADPRLETTGLLHAKAVDLGRLILRAAEQKNPALLGLMVEEALGHHGIPMVLPQDPDTADADGHMENLHFVAEVVQKAGWLGYADDVFGVTLRTSVEDVTLLSQEEGLRIDEVIRDAVRSPVPAEPRVAL